MKRIFFALLLCVTTASWAEVSLGANLHLRVNTDNDDTDFGMLVVPSLILTPAERIEIVPKAGFGVNTRIGEEDVTPGDNTINLDFQFIGGCGLFFRLIEKDPLRLSLGPDLTGFFGFGDDEDFDDSDVSGGGFYVSMPVHLDFLLSESFFIRSGVRVVTLGFHSWEVDRPDPPPPNDIEGDHFEFDIDSFLQPFFGFFFTF